MFKFDFRNEERTIQEYLCAIRIHVLSSYLGVVLGAEIQVTGPQIDGASCHRPVGVKAS